VEICSIKTDGYDLCLGKAAEYLLAGKIVCFPTETFYAIGVQYDNEEGLKRIAGIKKRPGTKSFSLIIGDRRDLDLLADHVSGEEARIIDTYWPGPLTLVFKAKGNLLSYIKDEQNTVAVRMPGPSFALDLARRLSLPVTATSANVSGMPPAKSVPEVSEAFSEGIDLIIDGGESTAAKPSTIIKLRKGKITVLREGAVHI